MRVLVMDGVEEKDSMISTLLAQTGCEVVHADCVAEIQEVARQQFDFVVMDWMTPDWIGGRTLALNDDVLEEILPGAAPVPVLLYSANDLRLLQFPLCRHFHVRSYLSKNATPEEQGYLLEQFVSELANGVA